MINLEIEKKLIELTKVDKSNFTTIYQEYVRDVYRYSYSKLWNKDQAEEITSITFLKALEAIDRFESRGISIKFWLFTIARNSINYMYKSKHNVKDTSLNVMEEAGYEITSQQDIEKEEISDADYLKVVEYMKTFGSIDNEIIMLKAVEGFTFEEIAEIVNLKLSNVKMKYYRAIREIKEKLSSIS